MSNLSNFVWSIADQLRGVYKPAQYGDVILPMTILRRMEAVLEDHRDEMNKLVASTPAQDALAALISRKFGLTFHNTSAFTLASLLNDPDNLAANLRDYLAGFSPNVADIFDRYGFDKEISKLDEHDRLFLVVELFSNVDLHPDRVTQSDMGDVFEDLIRRFAAASNETAGEHFTPRDAIKLMVDVLLENDDEALSKPGVIRSVYDPTAGTGGMLSMLEEHLKTQNPDASVVLYGQELNPQSYAICKSDLIAKGQDVDAIQLGDTLGNDKHTGKTFDYCLSNPPYGGDWKASEKTVKADRDKGDKSRFAAGLPRISDGQMLFLQHLASKMRPPVPGKTGSGARAGIVLNGSPLFTGGAGSGESEIRRWALESDLVDCIIALPVNMFYNTGIATYVWILDNEKPEQRRGKIQLIDGTGFFTKLRRNVGSKNREISDDDRARLLEIYTAFEDGEHAKILEAADFGYWEITVERPLQHSYTPSEENIDALLATKQADKLDETERDALRAVLISMRSRDLPDGDAPENAAMDGNAWLDRDEFTTELRKRAKQHKLSIGAPLLKAIYSALGEHDERAAIVTGKDGTPEPDPQLRDTEIVPFRDDITEYFQREVTPYVPDAWIDETRTKIGYEIPFTRLFYTYVPPRPLEEIDAELKVLAAEITEMLKDIGA